jgi:hypothetical protein
LVCSFPNDKLWAGGREAGDIQGDVIALLGREVESEKAVTEKAGQL